MYKYDVYGSFHSNKSKKIEKFGINMNIGRYGDMHDNIRDDIIFKRCGPSLKTYEFFSNKNNKYNCNNMFTDKYKDISNVKGVPDN